MYKIAVFVSGRGSNLQAIIDAISNAKINAEIIAVISDKIDCPAINKAKKINVNTFCVSKKKESQKITYSDLADKLISLDTNLIVLAGFLKKLPFDFVNQFANHIINIHPALLPSFGGKGMYGMNVHQAVFNSSVKYSGPTVHFVNNNYDEGVIIDQKIVRIDKVTKPEEIASLVLEQEHKLLPYIIGKFSENKVILKNNRVYIID